MKFQVHIEAAASVNAGIRSHVKLAASSGVISHSRGAIQATHPVLGAHEIGDTVVAVYDYMAFPQGVPARNLFAYSAETGRQLWRAEDIGMGAEDAYTAVTCESPLKVSNFAGYSCLIDIASGKVVRKEFAK